MLKVLFIDPPISSKGATAEVREFIRHKKYPLGILSIMTHVKDKLCDCEVKYLKVFESMSEREFAKDLAAFSPDIVGFPCYSYDFDLTYQIIKNVRKILPNTNICCGGPHITAFPKETIALKEVDSIVMGEGEEPFLNLCLHIKDKAPLISSGIYTKEDLREGRDLVLYLNKNLEEIASPDIKLIDDFISYRSFLTGKPLATMITSRGCPFVCNYCPSKYSTYRPISIQKIVDTMEYYVSLGIKEFEFWDETFNPSIKRLIDFAGALEQKKLPITFAIRGAVVSNVDYESLKSLKKVGLRRIQFGVESTCERLLKVMNKKIDREQIARAISLCNTLKISTVANMMVGLPTETEEEIWEDINFIKKVSPTYISINIYNYAPATDFYYDFLKRKDSGDFWQEFASNPDTKLFLHHCEDIISCQHLYRLQAKIVKEYYFRPAYLLHYLLNFRNDELLMSTRLALIMLFSSLKDPLRRS